jgi:glycosyltransferase involved in cell wall biosynthesis
MLIKCAEIDLMQPLQPIYIDWRYHQLDALVTWGPVPLGMLSLPCQTKERNISVERLRNELVQQFGQQVWDASLTGTLDRGPRSEQLLPAISVIVCTRDRPLSLKRCLETLARLDYPFYEVVVVDNCSRDPKVAQVVSESGFRYVREDRPGLDWARNRGIQEARYDIVAYIDDDALASPSWLYGVAMGFGEPDIMAVTGLVLPAEIETGAQHDFERYGGMSAGFTPYTIRRSEISDKALFWASGWGVGANMAFRRELFQAIGQFDVALDVGTPTCGGGDIEFFYRTVAAGFPLRYEPAALVRHVHRRDGASFRRLVYNNGRSFAAYLLTIMRNEPHRRVAVVRFALRSWLWAWLLRRLVRSAVKRDRWTFRLALIELWGCCSAWHAYKESQHAAARLKQDPLSVAPVLDAAI